MRAVGGWKSRGEPRPTGCYVAPHEHRPVHTFLLFSPERTNTFEYAGAKVTVNACVVCGEIGTGILLPCRKCGYKPTTSWEMAFAAYNSDHNLSRESVLAAGNAISDRYKISKPVFFRFSPDDARKLSRFLAEPSGRDILELRRAAKNGFLKRQLNFHIVGPDGYESIAVTRGKELPKKEFDSIVKLGSTDVFMIRAYVDGEPQDSVIDKDIWYAVKDHFNLLDRLIVNEGKMLSVISAMARHHTVNFLASRGLDLRENSKG